MLMAMFWLPWIHRRNQVDHRPVDVQASAKTLAALATPTKPAESEDPWAHYDPWSTPQKKTKTYPAQAITRWDLEAMEQRMEQKFKTTHAKPDQEDTTMTIDDDRVHQLEQRMNQLEVGLQQQQQTSMANHAETQSQLMQVKGQVEQQGQAFHSLLDQRFAQQLTEIERIMAKRPKTNE